ncbi:MAG TPA: hypothetical protein DDW65_17030 [Firmicutes bacterium]|jgi:branched-chain amino acid transport system ATP-binding protein|nr:hypothetical protein [Bacillota bacterium]
MGDSRALLHVNELTKNFKGLLAVDHYQLDISAGEIVGLIGPNGAGKTTVFNLLTGIFPPSSGKIQLKGQDITRFRPDQIAKKGMARTFQNIRLFGELSALQNVLVAAQIHKKYHLSSVLAGSGAFSKEEKSLNAQAEYYLKVLGIHGIQNQLAKNLAYGVQRKLEIARALATGPQVLLLDEPAAGMNHQESIELMESIRRLRDEFNLAIILIEHDMHVVMNLCQRLQVLSYGRIIAEGTPAAIKMNPMVIEAYLGRSKTSA